jgi:hypothetical protein
MAVSQESIVINNWEQLALTERKRTTGAGTKSRFTLDIKATAIHVITDPMKLGKPPADAIAKAVTKGIQEIGNNASLATQAARRAAQNAFNRGEAWAMERYAGGRTGAMPPGRISMTRLFNDSGRLAESVAARPNSQEGGYSINVAANRLNPETFKSGFVTMIQRLRDLVPVLQDPDRLFDDPGVVAAIKEVTAGMTRRQRDSVISGLARLGRTTGEIAETATDDG